MVNRGLNKSSKGNGRVILVVSIAAIVIVSAIAFPILKQRADAGRARDQAEQLITKGDTALTEGEVEDAIFAYMKAARICPQSEGVHLALGKAFMLDGRGDEAIDAVSKELDRDKDSTDAHLLLGFLYLLKATGNDPLGTYVVREMPEAMGYPGISGDKPIFAAGGDFPLSDALFHYKYVEELTPHEIRAAIGLAVMNALQGDHVEAESRFRELLQRAPDNTFIADALVRVPALAMISARGGPGGMPSDSPWLGPEFMEGDLLPPIETDWVEGDPGLPPIESKSVNPPAITGGDAKELPLPPGAEPEYIAGDEPMVNADGDLIVTPETFRKEPRTRPIGAISYSPGTPPVPVVEIGNLFSSGQVKLAVGQSGVVPNSGAEVKLLRVEGGNTVVLLEDGEEYTWVRGKVEWTLKHPVKEPESTDEAEDDEEDSESARDQD